MLDDRAGVLPGGFWDEAGRRHRTVALRPLTGHEEELLAGGDGGNPPALVTAVLGRCLTRLGEMAPVPTDVVRRLLVGDRDYLLLQLRQLTFGDEVRATLVCPWEACGEQVAIEFAVSDVPVHGSPLPAPDYTVRLSSEADDARSEIRFRLPNGADQEAVAPWAEHNEAAALTALLRRCVLGADPPSEDCVAALSPRARAELEAEMERLAPRVERTMTTSCVECGRPFTVPFDLHRFFFGDLRTDADLLYREVHVLAWHYGWSEPDVLALSQARRRTYIDLLAEEIEGLDDGH
ncbi:MULTISPECIES: hypothetical protein [unclassified Geodermatophilus]|uniref:T4 family baseplate hub assembly chaperone n=1 Tax=unclassified Geodermatophilus TaxID=2637632 RepID=UPI003EED4905